MKKTFRFGGADHTIELLPKAGGWLVRSGEREIDVQVRSLSGGALELDFPDRTVRLHTAADGDTRWVALDGRTYELRATISSRGRRGADTAGSEGALRAPMPGQVRAVNVAAGEAVEKGQTLMLLEAMKMEIRIQAPHAGTVVSVLAAEGEQVEREQILLEINA